MDFLYNPKVFETSLRDTHFFSCSVNTLSIVRNLKKTLSGDILTIKLSKLSTQGCEYCCEKTGRFVA